MLKKLALIGVAASIAFAPVVLAPLPAMAGRAPVPLPPSEAHTPTRDTPRDINKGVPPSEWYTPTADAPADPNEGMPSVSATRVKVAKPKLVKTKPTKSKPVKTKPAAPVASK